MEDTSTLREEIDRLRLENQFLQDKNNALLMEVHDLKGELEDIRIASEWDADAA